MWRMPSNPNPPRPATARGRRYWRSHWYAGDGRRRSKSFGACDQVSRAQVMIEYHRWLADWHAGGGHDAEGTPPPTVALMIERHAVHARSVYHQDDGKPTSEVRTFAAALQPFDQLFGGLLITELRASHLKAYLDRLRDQGVSRQGANAYLRRMKQWAKWCVGEDVAAPDLAHRWTAVPAIREGAARWSESDGVKAVPEDYVAAVVDAAPPTIANMIRLQLATGMRPDELLSMRPIDIDTSSTPWVYVPQRHKNKRRGKQRRVPIGPRARPLLEPYLQRVVTRACFVPQEVQDARNAERRASYVPPDDALGDYRDWRSAKRRRRGNPRYGERYTTDTYRQAIQRLCEAAGVPEWTPGQLRHNAEQQVERQLIAQGYDPIRARRLAGVVLGHSRVETTDIYADQAAIDASEMLERIG